MTRERRALQILSLTGFAVSVGLAVWGWQSGVLTSQEQMEALVRSCGGAGVLLFILAIVLAVEGCMTIFGKKKNTAAK